MKQKVIEERRKQNRKEMWGGLVILILGIGLCAMVMMLPVSVMVNAHAETIPVHLEETLNIPDMQGNMMYLDAIRRQTDRPLEIVDGDDLTAEYIESRDIRHSILVEHAWSTSDGNGYGTFADGCTTAYNATVPEGRTVHSYYVYNPYTDYVDDVEAVIDCGAIR